MKKGRSVAVSILWMLLGITLIGLGIMEILDAFWSGMGSAFFMVGAMQQFRSFRLKKDPQYREKVETEASDERIVFLRGKAWAWAGYLFVLFAAVASIVLRLLEQRLLSTAAGLAVLLIVVLYWGSYFYLRKRY